MGTNTQRVVAVEAKMAVIILRLPKMAAMADFCPFWRRSWIFSKITMEESTVIPKPRIKPDMVMRFTVKSKKAIAIKVSMKEMGMESPMMKELLRLRKNTKIISIAKIAPSMAELYTWFKVASMRVVSSLRTLTETPLGSCWLMVSSMAWIPLEIVAALVPDSLDTLI